MKGRLMRATASISWLASICLPLACLSFLMLKIHAFGFGFGAGCGSARTCPLLRRTGIRPAPLHGVRSLASSMLPSLMSRSTLEVVREKLATPPTEVINAVERAGRRVTVADVASFAGTDLRTAQKGVMTLASIVGGDLEVTTDGDIVYVFPPDFKSILRSRSVGQKLRETFGIVWPVLFYFIRISFGVLLLASVFVVFSSIMIISSSSSSSNNEREDNRSSRSSSNMLFDTWYLVGSPFDMFFYRPYGYGYYYTAPPTSFGVFDPKTTAQKRRGVSQINSEVDETDTQMGFLEAVFSYLFGDGDPNAKFESTQLQVVSQLIRQNNGAVVAEQLAPYLDPPPPDKAGISGSAQEGESAVVDESFVLPIITRLGGVPRVTEGGEIVYVFPELQLTAIDDNAMAMDALGLPAGTEIESKSTREIRDLMVKKGLPVQGALDKPSLLGQLKDYVKQRMKFSNSNSRKETELLPRLLQEKTLKFSLASGQQLLFAACLGLLNLGGALYLGALLSRPLTVVSLGSYGLLINALYGPLLAYALAFNVLPIVRAMWYTQINKQIEARNRSRALWATVMATSLPDSPPGAGTGMSVNKVKDKIAAAGRMAEQLKRLGPEDVYYSTADRGDQSNPNPNPNPNPSLEEFDRMLGGNP